MSTLLVDIISLAANTGGTQSHIIATMRGTAAVRKHTTVWHPQYKQTIQYLIPWWWVTE